MLRITKGSNIHYPITSPFKGSNEGVACKQKLKLNINKKKKQ